MNETIAEAAEAAFSWPHPLPICWVIGDGRPGLENQSLGLAEAMGLQPVLKRVVLRKPWRVASPYVTAFKRFAFSSSGARLEAPWPDIAIATGRPGALPLIYLREASKGRTFTVQVQDPVVRRGAFDRIVVPWHDGVAGDTVVTMDGSLHIITEQRLAAEAPRWAGAFAPIPHPRVAVLIGGANSRYDLRPEDMRALGGQLAALAAQGFGLLVSGSRRTGEANMAALIEALAGTGAYIYNGERGANPYLGMLAHADAFVVTCDSINMITETASTGKPVHIAGLPFRRGREGGRNKFAEFVRRLEASGRVRYFDGRIETWTYEPLREMDRVAQILRRAFLAR
ncbi:mitochondrial fission ELM1 family protein [Rhodomicrobium sp. Az07]|uniref:mitochondrial fission ELM1 family protein n=1 Tax=Rhodomicrobium sp. Az07 TaxID=2839034 RepID=UPI001BE8E6A5|nr:mitochondrial fission ELM1 family protein [Rhodomicrobium sp. Az07]MBT3069333.1 mitochondrial fission ELM1 family protein [Rhodomicrobium sp. Az07]